MDKSSMQQQRGVESSGKKFKSVPWFKHVSKQILRPSVSKSGQMLYSKGQNCDKDVLRNLCTLVDADNSEVRNKPQVAISMACETAEEAESVLGEEGIRSVKSFKKLLTSDLKDGIKNLNAMNGEEFDPQKLKSFLASIGEKDVQKKLRQAAIVGARLYMASISLLEVALLASNGQTWSDKMAPGLKKEFKHYKKKVPKFLAAQFADTQNRSRKTKNALAETESSEERGDKPYASSSSGPGKGSTSFSWSSSESEKAKKKKKKRRRKTKRQKPSPK